MLEWNVHIISKFVYFLEISKGLLTFTNEFTVYQQNTENKISIRDRHKTFLRLSRKHVIGRLCSLYSQLFFIVLSEGMWESCYRIDRRCRYIHTSFTVIAMEIQELLAGKREVLRWDCFVSYNYDVRTIQFKPRMTFHVFNISAAPKDPDKRDSIVRIIRCTWIPFIIHLC